MCDVWKGEKDIRAYLSLVPKSKEDVEVVGTGIRGVNCSCYVMSRSVPGIVGSSSVVSCRDFCSWVLDSMHLP